MNEINSVDGECPPERTRCEIYSRVVGYLTPTNQWNMGKKSEWRDRKPFAIPASKNV